MLYVFQVFSGMGYSVISLLNTDLPYSICK